MGAVGAGERVFFSFFSSDSEGTLETFVVAFGRLFGTKLGGVLNRHFLSVSEVTLGTFWAQFSCFSVLPCHGVFLSGSR